ncbi:MAG TPA: gamma-glutamyltransferase, partial [Bdellovibrionales bacterium]|nr:gamma-glutamyltransferase [Bdellovibrionales bacterium]
ETIALDFRETAPASADSKTYASTDPKASLDGGLAVGVPGVPAGLFELHKKYGKLKWNQLFKGAIDMAENGFEVSGDWTKITSDNKPRVNKDALAIFFPKAKDLGPGDVLKQPRLAKFLRKYQSQGSRAFYEGEVASDVISTVNSNGGKFTPQDLKKFSVRWLKPLTVQYDGHTVHLMPPPSSGGVVIAQALALIDRFKLKKIAELSLEELHLLIEIEKQSYRGRVLLGDPDFTQNPIAKLLADDSINALAKQINPKKATPSEKILTAEERKQVEGINKEKKQTTHMTVMDSDGNAVAMTVTLNGNYGSGLVTPKFGIALNNEMDDFTTKPGVPNMFGLIQGEANLVRAGARPLSSMSPTIVEKDGKTVLALGAPGGPRIISAVLQVLYRVISRGEDIETAILAPRVHHQFLPDSVKTDAMRLPPESITGLKKLGHIVETSSTAKVYGVVLKDDRLSAAADNRGEGAAGGY